MRLAFAALISLPFVVLTHATFAESKPADPYDVPWKEIPEVMRSKLPERLKVPILSDVARSNQFKITHERQFLDRAEAERFADGRGSVRLCKGCFAGDDVWLVSDPKKTPVCRRLLADVQAGRFSAIEPEFHETIDALLSKPQADQCDPLLRAASGADNSVSPPPIDSVWRVNLRLYPMGGGRMFVAGAAPCLIKDYRYGTCEEVDPTYAPGGMMIDTRTCLPTPGMETLLVSASFPGTASFLPIVVLAGKTTMIVSSRNQYSFLPGSVHLYLMPSDWAGATEYCIAESVQ